VSGRALGVIVVAGLLVVGFAIFYLGKRREPRTSSTRTEERTEQKRETARTPRRPPKVPVAAQSPEERERQAEEEEEEAQPTVDEARREFEAFLAELDREIERIDKGGERLTQEQWMKHRTRAAEVIDGVLRRLDHTDPRMIEEMKDKQDAVRTRLDRLKP
jgi:type IV secretory pathway VirB10-like protein